MQWLLTDPDRAKLQMFNFDKMIKDTPGMAVNLTELSLNDKRHVHARNQDVFIRPGILQNIL
jgi:hypothetical protein